jgi:hypothetical protein
MSISPLPLRGIINRRRTLPLAAAALSLAGCGMFAQQAAAPIADPQDTDQRVKRYQADIEQTLDMIDRDRLRTAAQRKLVTVTVTTAPAFPQTPVILASAGPAETPDVAPQAVPTPAPKTDPVPAPLAAGSIQAKIVTSAGAETTSVMTAVKPATVLPTAAGIPSINAVNSAPLSGETGSVPAAVITPFTPPSTPSASAMGSMTALVSPAEVAAAEPAVVAKVGGPSLEDALTIVRKSVEDHPTLNSALALALLSDASAGDIGKKLSATDQKVLGDLLAALEAMKGPADGSGDKNVGGTTVTQRAGPLVEAAKNWQQEADLALPRMVLATRVDSFGVFTPLTGIFEQGKRHTVIIYCEVANFAAKKGDDSFYTTKLAQQETLITDDGLLVWRPNAEEIEDRSLNQRRDFYLVKKLTIPETLAAGKYTLRMSVTDRTTNKIAVVSLPIEIAIKP